jgi:CheY-like chemotaxis protein
VTDRTRVLLVDDDPWTCGGALAALRAVGDLDVRASKVAPALAEGVDQAVDVLVVDVRDRTSTFDRYRGVGLIEQVRRSDALAGARRPVLALTSDHDLDLLAVRVAEAGADVLWRWDDIGTDHLVAAVHDAPPVAHLDERSLKVRVGVDPCGRVNDFVAELVQQDLVHAFSPGTTQRGSGLPRRRSMAVRRLAGEVAGLRTTATVGETALETPSWREVRRFVQRALGLDVVDAQVTMV